MRNRTLVKIWIVSSVLGAASVLGSVAVAAGDYPSRTVKVIVPYSPGGAVDIVGREISGGMSKRLGESFVVENRPGAGSNLAMAAVAAAEPDGYTLLVASPAAVVNKYLYKDLPYDTLRDFAPIGLAAKVPSVLIASPVGTASSVQELLQSAKQSPSVVFAHGGNGSSEHLASEMLRMYGKVNFISVPYKGGMAALPDLMAGRVHYMFTSLMQVKQLIESGKVKALAVADDKRSPSLPNVPTFAEAGLPEIKMAVWYGLLAPKQTPPQVIETLSGAMQATLQDAGLRKQLEDRGADILNEGPQGFAKFLSDQDARAKALIETQKISIN